MPTYQQNPENTAQGRPGSVYGQAEVERAADHSTIRVETGDAKTRNVGNPTGDGSSRQYTYIVAPCSDKPYIFEGDRIGKP